MTNDENFVDFPFLHRRYIQVKTENLDQLCDLLGYGSSMKHKELNETTTFYMDKNVDCSCFGKKCYRNRITNQVGMSRVKFQFKPGQEFTEFVYGNGFGKSLITFEGNRMIHVHRGKREIRTVSEFTAVSMVSTITVEHITAKRYFNAF